MLANDTEPLSIALRPAEPPAAYAELRARYFSFMSRGDRVRGRLLLPAQADGPFPVVLLQHGAGGSKEAPYIDATAGPWARRELAVASIDFPLHGRRAEGKLSELLLAELSNVSRPASGLRDLAQEFRLQALSDLRRALDTISEFDEIDAERLGYAGFSLGSILGAAFCGAEPRLRAAALALGGAGFGCFDRDGVREIANFAPRPLLFVNTRDDETIPRAAAEALFEAAREPKEHRWFDGTHTQLPGEALKAMFQFLNRHLRAEPNARAESHSSS